MFLITDHGVSGEGRCGSMSRNAQHYSVASAVCLFRCSRELYTFFSKWLGKCYRALALHRKDENNR